MGGGKKVPHFLRYLITMYSQGFFLFGRTPDSATPRDRFRFRVSPVVAGQPFVQLVVPVGAFQRGRAFLPLFVAKQWPDLFPIAAQIAVHVQLGLLGSIF